MIKKICLTIAGSDSGGEAGIQADLKTFDDFDCHGLTVISAVTAQNPKKISSLNPVSAQIVKDQLLSLLNFFDIKFIKTGLLPSIEIMEIILENLPSDATLITDPIISSTSGTKIMSQECFEFFKDHFAKRIDFLTPNTEELSLLSPLGKNGTIIEKCHSITHLFKKGLFLKGGHSNTPEADHFYENNIIYRLTSPRLKLKSSHGTGCRISSAFCASLSQGENPLNSAIFAKNYVHHALKNCQITEKDQWLIGSPGKAATLENCVTVEKIL